MPTRTLEYEGLPQPPRGPRCPACRSDLTVKGDLTEVGFKPREVRGFFKSLESLNVAALACCACGTVTLKVKRGALRNLAGYPPK